LAKQLDVPEHVNVKEIRERLGLSQEEFAMRFGFDAASLRNWEQGRTEPEAAVRSFFKVIETHPETVENALGSPRKNP
jgi:putative transcriptional regulator